MKLSLFRGFVICLVLIACFSAKAALKPEYDLDLKATPVAFENYNNAAKNFSSFFHVNLNCPDPPGASDLIDFPGYVYETFVSTEIKRLETTMNDATMTDRKFFRALRIFYAVDDGGDLFLIYYCDHAILESGEGTDEVTFRLEKGADITDLADGDPVYIRSANRFTPKTYGDVKSWVQKYRSKAYVARDQINPECYGNTATNVKGVLYAFQEIKNFDMAGSYVYFTHVTKVSTLTNPSTYKHDIQVANVFPFQTGVRPAIADLGSLCPVNCPTVTAYYGVLRSDKFLFNYGNMRIEKYKKLFRFGRLRRD